MAYITAKKNEAFEVVFPMVDETNPEDFSTGDSPTDTAYYKDGAGAWTSLVIIDTAAEIATTGMYEISLTAGEMNHDWIAIKFTATGNQDTMVVIKTYTRDVDDLAYPTTAGRSIDVTTGGCVGIDWANVETPGSSVSLSSTTVSTTTTVTNDVGITATAVDNIWDETLTAHVTADSAAVHLKDIIDDTGTSGVVVAAASKTGYQISGTITTLDGLENVAATDIVSSGAITTSGGAVSTVTDVTNDVNVNMGQSTPGSPTADTTGEALRFAHERLDVVLSTRSSHSAADTADAVWDETSAGHVDAGKAGQQLWTDVDAILADTGTDGVVIASAQSVQTVTGNVDGSVASVTGAVGSVTGAVGSVTGNVGGNVVGNVASLGTTAKSDVNAEVVDVLKTDTISEMSQQAPPATPTFEEAVMYLYMAIRNKIDVTSSLKEFHNDAGTVIWKKTLSDDATTYTEAEGVSGP